MPPEDNASAEADTPAVPDVIRYELSKPILAYGKQISVLEMSRPTGADLVRVGNPVIFTPFTDPPRVEHDFAKVIAMVARLAKVPSPSLEALDPDDLVGLAWGISPFFMPRR